VTEQAPANEIGGKGLLLAGLLVGFFIIPPLANASPKVVNGFLLLVLFGSLLFNRDRWLPAFERFSGTVSSSSSKAGASTGGTSGGGTW